MQEFVVPVLDLCKSFDRRILTTTAVKPHLHCHYHCCQSSPQFPVCPVCLMHLSAGKAGFKGPFTPNWLNGILIGNESTRGPPALTPRCRTSGITSCKDSIEQRSQHRTQIRAICCDISWVSSDFHRDRHTKWTSAREEKLSLAQWWVNLTASCLNHLLQAGWWWAWCGIRFATRSLLHRPWEKSLDINS